MRFNYALIAGFVLSGCISDRPTAESVRAEPGESPTAEQPRASEDEIDARYRTAIENQTRDEEFEASTHDEVEAKYDGLSVRDMRCSVEACYFTVSTKDVLLLENFMPDAATLPWLTRFRLHRDLDNLTVFVAAARDPHSLPEVDFSE